MKTKIITRIIWILSLVSLFTDVASEMLYPVMPVFLRSIGFSFLLIGVLPWIAVFAQSLKAATVDLRPANNNQHPTLGIPFQPRKLLLVWIAAIFVFFSASSSKLPAYILPIFPAIAILIALYLPPAKNSAWKLLASSSAIFGLLLIAAATQILKFAGDPSQLANFEYSQPWLVAGGIVLFSGALPILNWRNRLEKEPALRLPATLFLAFASLITIQLLLLGSEPHGRFRSGAPLVPAINAELTPTMPLYAVGLYDQTLPFYLGRTMTLVQHPDELEFGLKQDPSLWLPTLNDFVQRWLKGPKAVAVMRVDIFDGLRAYGVPMREITRKGRQVVVTNR